MSDALTQTQKDALAWLAERNGSGVFDKLGRLIAAGEIVGKYCGDELVSAVSSATWARLFACGMIEPDGRNRARLTDAGRTIVDQHRRRARQ